LAESFRSIDKLQRASRGDAEVANRQLFETCDDPPAFLQPADAVLDHRPATIRLLVELRRPADLNGTCDTGCRGKTEMFGAP
jgi:hypothetical protein